MSFTSISVLAFLTNITGLTPTYIEKLLRNYSSLLMVLGCFCIILAFET